MYATHTHPGLTGPVLFGLLLVLALLLLAVSSASLETALALHP